MSNSKRSTTAIIATALSRLFNQFPGFPWILKWVGICAILGILIGSASAAFLFTLDRVTGIREQNSWILWLLPVAGFGIGWVYHRYGSGLAAGNHLLFTTVHHPGRKIPLKMAFLVYASTIITHLFGGSAWREGTAVQMAGSIADQLSRPLRLRTEERKILLVAAVAAGFGSVFGTPLAGALFALEVFLIGQLRYPALLPALSAAVLADQVTRWWQVGHTHYSVGLVPPVSFTALLYVLLTGLAFGCCAALFTKLLHRLTAVFARVSYPPLRPVLGGLLVIGLVMVLGTTQYLGLGIPGILEAFEKPQPAGVFLLKILFTVVTLAAGFKGGEVTPLFFIGAALGSALSIIVPLPTALLAAMGFVAVFAGATNTPLACTLMGMELFGADGAVYIGLSCVISYFMSGHNSIYTAQIVGKPKHEAFAKDQGKAFGDL